MQETIVSSALFVPGIRPERIPKALESCADAVIVDLEDAVAEQLKVDNLDTFLDANPKARVQVRINASQHEQQAADLALCRGQPGVTAASQRMLDQARYALLLHSTLAQLAPPLYSVFPNIKNPDGMTHMAAEARDMGFGGLLCVHPSGCWLRLAPGTECSWSMGRWSMPL